MEMVIDFPGGVKVDAHFGAYTVRTDQPPTSGGDGSAPNPFDLFLASLGTCVGFYVLGFCQQRDLPTEGIRVIEHIHNDPESGMVGKIDLEIQVPPDFPEKYLPSLIRAAELCKVKKHIENPPKLDVFTKVTETTG